MAVVQSSGVLTADVGWWASWWPRVNYGALQMYDQFNYDYATLYKQQPNIRTCVDFLARNIAQLGLHVFRRVSDTDRVRLTDHPLAQLIARPLPPEFKVTAYRLMESLMGDLGVYFNAYWLKIRMPDARLGLLRIPPQLVYVYGGLTPTGYEVYLGGTPQALSSRTFSPSEVVHFRGYNPEDPVSGLSPLETLRRVLAEEQATGDYREHFWKNAARQAGIIERPANAPEWSTDARARFKQEFEALYSGGDNSGKTAILEEGMTWRAGTFNAQESEYLAGRKLTREECARAYHIPLPMVGILDHATFSNITEQHKNLYQDSLGPWLAMIEQEIELQLLPEFDDTGVGYNDGVYVEFNIAEKLQGSFDEQAKTLQSAVGRPWMTPNEARAKLNLPSLGGDADELATPLNLTVGAPAPAPAAASQTGAPPEGKLDPIENRVARLHFEQQMGLGQEQRTDALKEFNAALADFRAAMAAGPTETMPHEMKLVVEGLPQGVVTVNTPVTLQPQPIQAIQAKLDVLPTPVTVQNNVSVEPTPVTIENQNTVNVEPTPVTVENQNNVLVPPQPVTLTMQGVTSVVKRDEQGRIDQIESVPEAG